MKKLASSTFILFVLAVPFVTGCEELKTSWWRFFDPSTVVRAPDNNLTNPIYSSASTADETLELPPNATTPTPDDLEYTAKDYVLGPNDILDISILDLFSEGLETILRRQVTENGMIDLPLLPERIKADGLTKDELQERIIQAYSPDILKNPTVSVTIVVQRQNTFSILGAVARPATYNLTKPDMRLLDALATAGGQSQTNIRYIYVIRPGKSKQRKEAQAAQVKKTSAEGDLELPPLPEIPMGTPAATPVSPAPEPAPAPAMAPAPALPPVAVPAPQIVPVKPETAPASAPAAAAPTAKELNDALPGGVHQPETAPALTPSAVPNFAETAATPTSAKWVQTNNGNVKVEQPASPAPSAAPAKSSPAAGKDASAVKPLAARPASSQPNVAGPGEDPFGWKRAMRGDETRIIAINLGKLNAGDPRMNIIVRDNDIINVPLLDQGEFYMMGEVLRPGVYSLTGRRVTIKMAIAAAGNPSPLAWPSNSILVRRIGDNQEQMIPVNIEKIYRGLEPDLYLKPDDVIAVGTSAAAPFMAVFRNAFRMTYGFGFIYDRNFADAAPGQTTLNSQRFTRW